MKEKLQKIFNAFGYDHQKMKLIEEAEEFIESLEDEEIADLYVLTNQLYNNSQVIRELVDYKIDRTLKRLKTGFYKPKGICVPVLDKSPENTPSRSSGSKVEQDYKYLLDVLAKTNDLLSKMVEEKEG